ncbi:hypothetical protein [Nocardia cyriacigeorgica]|uniref:Uncharacterized protein n=1 Tax=Nocardia cyriacigeorgica TaxID=135487 RepID=A0A5R8NB67_9NOCA|nr:hypothetical protein [Nocardia cyriacigeorgica]TLF72904.1 hypothetical protein FEK34_28180 [Nocardia cyriacigeorgica]
MATEGEARRAAARRRLRERRQEDLPDSELVSAVMADLFDAVSKRQPLTDDEASELVFEETERMRFEKRNRDHVGAPRRG